MAAQKRIPQLACGLMEGAFSEEEERELRLKEWPAASDLTSHCSCTSLVAVPGTGQICSLPQGLCTYYSFANTLPWTPVWLPGSLSFIALISSDTYEFVLLFISPH